MHKDKGFDKKFRINKRSFYPKSDLDRVLRFLRNQKLDDVFKYDKITVPTIEINNQTNLMVPDKQIIQASKANIQTPPLPDTPMPDQRLVASMPQVNQQTGLTRNQSALLSPTEKVIAGRT